MVCACAGFVINSMKMGDLLDLCYFRFQESTTVLPLFQLLPYYMETTDIGLILLCATYYLSKLIQNPLKYFVFLRSKIYSM